MEKYSHTTHQVLLVFYNSQVFHESSYTRMSLRYIREQLRDFHDITLSISGLKYQLAKIKRLKLMRFYKNDCGRRSDGTVYRKPSNRMFLIRALQYFARCQVAVVDWLWDVVTQKVKLPRRKGLGYYEKKQLAEQKTPDAPNGVLKLISKIGKGFGTLKLFT